MTPATIALIIGLVEEVVKVAPEAAAELKNIFSVKNPTPDDWSALRAKVLAKSYADYVPASSLTPENPT